MSYDFFTLRKPKDGFSSKESSYTVGLDKHGYTMLIIHSADGCDTTLFMNQHSTKHLIRLLQATLNEENNNE
jgi:hypothetical protein